MAVDSKSWLGAYLWPSMGLLAYAYQTSEFFANKTLEILFPEKKLFQRWNDQTCYQYQVFYNSQKGSYAQNNWDFF